MCLLVTRGDYFAHVLEVFKENAVTRHVTSTDCSTSTSALMLCILFVRLVKFSKLKQSASESAAFPVQLASVSPHHFIVLVAQHNVNMKTLMHSDTVIPVLPCLPITAAVNSDSVIPSVRVRGCLLYLITPPPSTTI